MMIFYRSPAATSGRGPSLKTVRTCVAVALLAYPVGALIMVLGRDDPGALKYFDIAGLALILIALTATVPVIGSHFQRIVGEQPQLLDEFELKLRQREMSAAYAAFTALALLAIIYAAIASDAGLWVPDSYDEFNGLFWGVFLYATLLPTAFLLFAADSAAELAEADEDTAR